MRVFSRPLDADDLVLGRERGPEVGDHGGVISREEDLTPTAGASIIWGLILKGQGWSRMQLPLDVTPPEKVPRVGEVLEGWLVEADVVRPVGGLVGAPNVDAENGGVVIIFKGETNFFGLAAYN